MREMNLTKYACVALMMSFQISLQTSYASVVDGIIALEDQTNHIGITIEFLPKSPTAKYALTTSDALGQYSDSIENGIYDILYTYTGYITKTETGVFISNDVTLSTDTLRKPIIPPTDVKNIYDPFVRGIWYKDTIYHIHNDISVLAQDSLFIQPGTHIYFEYGKSLTINHKVHAHGTDSLPIVFDSLSWPSDFVIEIKAVDSVHISNVHILNSFTGLLSQGPVGLLLHERNGNKGHFIEKVKLVGSGISSSGDHLIQDCDISAGGITSLKGRPYILHNIIWGSTRIGIQCRRGVVSRNEIYNCNGGMILDSTEDVSYNLIYQSSIGMSAGKGVDKIYNNTFYENRTALSLSYLPNSIVDMQMNIFVGNDVGVNFNGRKVNQGYNLYNNTKDFDNATIQGLGVNIATNANDDPVDTYFNITNYDTTFLRTNPSDLFFLRLSSYSMAINASDSSFKNPDGSIRDFGAFPYDSVIWEGVDVKMIEEEAFRVYPNPAVGSFYLEWMNESEDRTIQIFNTNGEMLIEEKLANQVKMEINIEKLPRGLYFIKALSDSGQYSVKFIKK